MMKTVAELAEIVGGTFSGEGSVPIRGASPMHNAADSDITFLENLDKLPYLKKSKAVAVVLPESAKSAQTEIPARFSCIYVEKVLESFEKIVHLFLPMEQIAVRAVHPSAIVASSAKIGSDVLIGPCAVVGENVEIGDSCTIHGGVQIFSNCKIGKNTTIFPNTVVYENCVIGSQCIIHSCSVIGAFGFGYDSSKGFHRLSSQLGNVVIADSVEVGACSTIDRGTYGSTQIGQGTKIDNLVMIAHNCKIGKFNLICAHTGIAGSTTTGDYVVMAGRVGVRDHVHIGDRAILGAMAGIMSDVPEGVRWVGIPATPEKEQMKKQVALAKLPEMRKELKTLQQQVAKLEKKLAESEQ